MTADRSTITLEGPSGTVFPNSPSYYLLQDATTPSGSGEVSTPLSGGGTNDVTLTVPSNINAGDLLALTVEDAINPSSASNGYSLIVLGEVTGPSAVAAFPHATSTYPNGAIVQFAGTAYVFAGGRGFGIQSLTALEALQKVDHATVQNAPAGTSPPGGPRDRGRYSPPARSTGPPPSTSSARTASSTALPPPNSSWATVMTRPWS